MAHKKIVHILIIIWIVNLLVGLLVVLTDLSLSPYRLFYLQFSFFVSGLPLINWIDKRTNRTRLFGIWTFVICNSVIAFFYLFLDWRGEWKTQTIEYQNLHLSNRTIEFQMQDKGARGYNRRYVDRIKILPFVEWTKEVKSDELDTLTWKKVSIYVNELGLKGG
jgi:hypothetical protein